MRQVLDAYFGPNGIEYSVGRIPMGSCDFSEETYSFDDVPGDYNLTHFDDGVERDTAQRVRGRGTQVERGRDHKTLVGTIYREGLWCRGTRGEGRRRGRNATSDGRGGWLGLS